MAISYPLVNGKRSDFTSLRFNIFGEKYVGVKSIDYKISKKKKKIHGTPDYAIARTRGQSDASGSLEVLRDEGNAILAALAAKGDDPMDVEFDIVISFANKGQKVQTDRCISVVITDIDLNFAQGEEPNMIKFDLDIMELWVNGVRVGRKQTDSDD